jgi:hypothetical protein
VLYFKLKDHNISWHAFEPLPKEVLSQRVLTVQADGDELALLLDAMTSKIGVQEVRERTVQYILASGLAIKPMADFIIAHEGEIVSITRSRMSKTLHEMWFISPYPVDEIIIATKKTIRKYKEETESRMLSHTAISILEELGV